MLRSWKGSYNIISFDFPQLIFNLEIRNLLWAYTEKFYFYTLLGQDKVLI